MGAAFEGGALPGVRLSRPSGDALLSLRKRLPGDPAPNPEYASIISAVRP